MAPDDAGRNATLDLIRGVAVLGILAVNLPGFAGPPAALLSPHWSVPGSFADELGFAAVFVLFEGKMRALFTLLFGAGMVLFIDRAEARGRDGDILQFRRLVWLLLFGLLHHFLFWWGDILFIYAAAGVIALFMRDLPVRALVAAALILFAGWHLGSAIAGAPEVAAEEQVRRGTATPAVMQDHADFLRRFHARAQGDLAEARLGFADHVAAKVTRHPFRPFAILLSSIGETLPLILIGMALQRTGFFGGGWPSARLRRAALAGIGSGLLMTLPMLAWLWERQFPPRAMNQALLSWTAPPHLAMALGYAALLVMAAPRLAPTATGRLLVAAGRMAFTNYIATTVVMTAIFYGWGLGLAGTLGHAAQWPFVLLGWALMLGWSAPWLARFRQGPLEWAWRSLVERRFLPFRH